MTTELHNETLEWAAEWIEGSLKGEANERVTEFGRNMAMTLRAAKSARIPAPSVAPVVDEEALHRLICGVVHEHCKDVQLPRGTNGLEADLIKAIRAPAATVAPVEQSERSNHFSNAAIDKGMFPDHISSDGTAYYADGTVLRPAPASPAAIRDDPPSLDCLIQGHKWDREGTKHFCTHCGTGVDVGPITREDQPKGSN